MQFGIFDHLDDAGLPAPRLFAERLDIVAGFEAAGFERYQLAEHHGTPLGFAPSPNVFLSAVASRTSRIRLGALVNLIPIYDPLRLLEEICMLDNISNGRLDLGLGRGASPVELAFFGVPNRDVAREMYLEGLAMIERGLVSDELTFEGSHYNVKDFPVVMHPVQKPMPPIWTGTNSIESAITAARHGANVVCLGPAAGAKAMVSAYRETWDAHNPGLAMPCIGLVRHIVVADTREEAREIARRAYGTWRVHMNWLWQKAGTQFTLGGIFPETFEELEQLGHGFAGTPDEVTGFLREVVETTGMNYMPLQMIFGHMTRAECARSTELFSSDVMPVLRREFP